MSNINFLKRNDEQGISEIEIGFWKTTQTSSDGHDNLTSQKCDFIFP
jgi:hypothetical protein